jgi:hypothetical protein
VRSCLHPSSACLSSTFRTTSSLWRATVSRNPSDYRHAPFVLFRLPGTEGFKTMKWGRQNFSAHSGVGRLDLSVSSRHQQGCMKMVPPGITRRISSLSVSHLGITIVSLRSRTCRQTRITRLDHFRPLRSLLVASYVSDLLREMFAMDLLSNVAAVAVPRTHTLLMQ